MAEVHFFIRLVIGLIITFVVSILVVIACENLSRWLWKDGAGKEND